MSRGHKRRNRPARGGFGKTQTGNLQVDHTLIALVRNFMALPPGSTLELGDGRMAVSEEAHLYLTAMRDHVGPGPSGQARVKAALMSMLPKGGVH